MSVIFWEGLIGGEKLTFVPEEVYFGKARDVVGELRSMDIFIFLVYCGS